MSIAILAAVVALQGPTQVFVTRPPAGACPEAWRPTPVAGRAAPARFTKLGDLPKAALILPVLRMVEGCPVPTVVRDQVEGDGRFAKSPN
jgi:hypothetical protein